MIPKIAYKDFLIKQEKLPKREDKNYVDFWMEHINYCKSGVSVGGIFISGWLYWHINFFKITIDKLDEWGNPVSEITNLDLRDNEWMIDYAFNKTDKDKKDPLTVVGTRRFAKTVFIASRLAYKAFIFQNSHIIIAGASATDISNITKYFDEYYSLRQDCFSDLTKVGDWNRSSGSDVEIAFSKRETLKKDTLTKKAGKINPITPHLIEIGNDNKYIFSRIAIRNLEHGQVKTKEELLAGITPTEVIWDEALDEDEIIPTMNGYKTVKELKINDFILGKNGKETKIVDKIDVGIKGIYEVSLMDGRKVKACGDHLWEVWDNDTNEYKVVRTSTIPLGQFSIDRCEGVVGNEESLKYSATKDKKRDEIKTVKYLHKKQAYCFKVDNEDSLFLAGQYVVTHNCGKYHWEKQHEALVPALSTKFGKRATEVLVGCLTENNKVWTNDGRLISIKDINQSDGIKGFDITAQKATNEDITYLQPEVFKECIRIETNAGSHVECSAEHPILIKKNNEYIFVESKDLTINDLVCLPTEVPLSGENNNLAPYTKENAIPNDIHSYGKKDVGEFVTKMFNEEGTLNENNEITIRSKTKENLLDIKLLLIRLGVHSEIYVSESGCAIKVKKEDLDNIKTTSSNGIKTEKITSITKIGAQRVYNLTANNTHTYLANGIITHNTGGNIDFSKDIEKAFLEPRDIGFYHFNLEEYKDTLVDGMFPYEQISDLKTGLFVPAQLSLEGGEKIIMPLSSFIKKTYSKQDLKDLEGFTIEVTDWKNATDKINNYLDISANKSDSAYKKAQMYYPFQPEDCFLHSGNNPFPVEEAKKMQNIIKEKGLQGSYYNLTQNEHGIVLNETDKQPITQYPYEGGSYDAPVVILEPPIAEAKNIKRGTYVAGFDGYKVEESQTTDSVGSIYIYKRKVGISGYQDQLVAYYSSRPSRFDDFHTQVLYLLKLYNAELLPETDSNLYNFLRSRNSLNYLADCRNLVEGITPNSKAFMNYGLPATKKNQEHYMKLIVDYTQENILEGIDEDGNEIYTKGIFRIQDPMLLEEMIKFGKLKNYDRLVAFGHALAWDFELGDSGITGGIQLENDKSITPLGIISKIKANRTKWR